MEPIEAYTFDNYTNLLVPYEGTGKKLRPVIKWLMIVYVVVIIGISTLLLKEQSLFQALGKSFPALVCIAWLWYTRSRTQEIRTPITVSFYRDAMVFDSPEDVGYKKGKNVRFRTVFRIPYDTVTDANYSLGMGEVTVHGMVESEVFYRDASGVLESSPSWTKKGKAAAGYWTKYISPEENERVLAAITKYTGKEVRRYGGKYAPAGKQDREG